MLSIATYIAMISKPRSKYSNTESFHKNDRKTTNHSLTSVPRQRREVLEGRKGNKTIGKQKREEGGTHPFDKERKPT